MAGAIAGTCGAASRGQAIQLIDEPAGNAQRRIDGEQAGQTIRLFRVDLLVRASQSPGALEAVAGLRWRAHRLGRRVVQEAAEGVAAELVVLAGEQDELMPGIVDRLRRHGHHAPAGLATKLEVIVERSKHLVALLGRQPRVAGRQTLAEKALVGKGGNVGFTPRSAPVAPEQNGYERQ